eukprot:scaffold986_cov237-Pinguiococcus_pyrenoidosus.AAC.26
MKGFLIKSRPTPLIASVFLETHARYARAALSAGPDPPHTDDLIALTIYHARFPGQRQMRVLGCIILDERIRTTI